jgi:DNA processing protein
LVHATPLDPSYPSRLRFLPAPPPSLTLRGGAVEADRTVAIVGTRYPHPQAYAYAGELAKAVAKAGGVVVSGGALGIDEAAHLGALEAGGRTWCIAGTGHMHCFPPEHADLFERIAAGPGAMVWPFAPSYMHRTGFLARNGILAALADVLVVVQAGFPSGALRAASSARKLKRPLWVVPVPPWEPWSGVEFEGSRRLLASGASPLLATASFLQASGFGLQPPAPEAPLSRPLSETELRVLSATSAGGMHLDSIVEHAHLPAQAVSAALLTLALENVVVEGPPGFFRRALAVQTSKT